MFALFFLFQFLFIPMPCTNFIGQFVSYHNTSWSSVKKLNGRFWDASSFLSGNLAPRTGVLRRPNLEGCLSLGIGTRAPPLSIFYRILSLVHRSNFYHKLWNNTGYNLGCILF